MVEPDWIHGVARADPGDAARTGRGTCCGNFLREHRCVARPATEARSEFAAAEDDLRPPRWLLLRAKYAVSRRPARARLRRHESAGPCRAWTRNRRPAADAAHGASGKSARRCV